MSQKRSKSYSFSGVLPLRDDLKIARQKLEMLYQSKKQPTRLRRLSLATLKLNEEVVYKQRKYKGCNLERSVSLPDAKSLSMLQVNTLPTFSTKNKLMKARSVTFHTETICLNAAADNDVDELEEILSNDVVDINYKNSCGLSMAHHAAASGSFECLQLLIENSAEINTFDDRELTPLDLAIRGGYFDCALILINAGARVEKIVNGLQ